MPTETTLVLLKPDAVRRGLVAELIGRFERRGFRIRGLKQLVLERSVAEEHYAEHSERPFFGELVDVHHVGPARRARARGAERDLDRAHDDGRDESARLGARARSAATTRSCSARTSCTAPTRPRARRASCRSTSATASSCPRGNDARPGVALAAAPRASSTQLGLAFRVAEPDYDEAPLPVRAARARRAAQPRQGALGRRPRRGRPCSASTRSCSSTARCSASPRTPRRRRACWRSWPGARTRWSRA